MKEIEVVRNSHLVDPQLHVWGWEIPFYLFLGGLAAGVMIFSALLTREDDFATPSSSMRLMPFAVPVLLSVGMFILLLDLEYKAHVYRFYMAFRPASPMSWGAWILLAVYPASLGLGVANLRLNGVGRLPSLAEFLNRRRRALAAANIALGVALGVYTGILLSTLGVARPMWNSALLGPLFLVSGISTGAALMMLFPLSHKEHSNLRRWDLAIIGLEALLLFLFVLGLITGGGMAGRQAIFLIMGGPYTAPFWALVVLAGLVVPFLLETIEGIGKRHPTRLAPVLLLVGGLSLRWIIVLAGQV